MPSGSPDTCGSVTRRRGSSAGLKRPDSGSEGDQPIRVRPGAADLNIHLLASEDLSELLGWELAETLDADVVGHRRSLGEQLGECLVQEGRSDELHVLERHDEILPA